MQSDIRHKAKGLLPYAYTAISPNVLELLWHTHWLLLKVGCEDDQVYRFCKYHETDASDVADNKQSMLL